MSNKTCAPKRVQCHACPWKVSTDPARDIPGGYDVHRHENLKDTIADPERFAFEHARRMACHEFPPGKEQVCVGWVIQQLGPGNNIALRIEALDGRYDNFRTVGPQHDRFEDTLPRTSRQRKTRR